MYSSTIENECLVVKLSGQIDDLSFISALYNEKASHLILNLLEFDCSDVHLFTKFAKFGKKLVGDNSFVMVSTEHTNSDWMPVPTLQEAFDIVELENIERQLNQ